MSKVKIRCDYCGKEFEKYPSRVTAHNFCSKKCLGDFSSKSKNPNGYAALKDYSGQSENMKQLNSKLNPTRMTEETKRKLRSARLGTGAGKTYEKTYGRHTHRVVAEQMLGRPLKPGEVVHHIDGNKRNNVPENLKVFSSQAEHAKWHKEHEGVIR